MPIDFSKMRRYQCPGCGKTAFLDEENQRAYHEAPLCEAYAQVVKGAKRQGIVMAIVVQPKEPARGNNNSLN